MSSSTIYHSGCLTPYKIALATLLDQSVFEFNWQAIECLQEVPVSGMVLLHESDVQDSDPPLIGARKVLMVLAKWNFNGALKWVEQGANDSAGLEDLERIATWVVAEQSRSIWHNPQPSDQQNTLQTVIDAIPVPIFYKDAWHIYRGCNLAFSEFIGLSKEKIIDHSVYDVAPKELADIYYQADQALLAKGGKQEYETDVKNAQGERFEIEFHKAVFYKSNGSKGGQVGVMLDVTEKNRLMRELDKVSRTDPLTGVGNRREFDDAVSSALGEAQASYSSISLLTIDVDHFKSINDQFGHSCGDEALKFLVRCIYLASPSNASIYRIGGEEFYVLLPRTNLAEARSAAEKVCQHIPSQPLILKGEQVNMTVSIGAIQLASEQQLEDSFKRVDQALYEAKMTGRNRVCLAYYD